MSSIDIETLGANPEIETKEQLPLFLRCIAGLRSFAEKANTKLKDKIRKLTEANEESLKISVDDETLAIMEYSGRLEAKVCDFARDHHGDLFSDKRKTWKSEAGSITTKTQPEKVAFIDPNTDEEELVNKIIEETDLVPELDRLRAEFFDAFPYLRIKLTIDRAGILKAWQDKSLTAEDLHERGLKIVRDDPKYTVKIA